MSDASSQAEKDMREFYGPIKRNEQSEVGVEKLVMQKTAVTSEPIMNITKFRYDNVMNILDSVKNAEIKVPIDLFLKLDQNSKEKILSDTIKQMQKSVAFAMETLSSFTA